MAEYKFRRVSVNGFTRQLLQKISRDKIETIGQITTKDEGDGFILSLEIKNLKDKIRLHQYLSNYPGYQWSRGLGF